MSANPSKQSFLSSPKYGYDFVVATTQASINSGLKEYISSVDQPETFLCFLADSKGNPTVELSLDQLLAKTGGVNPFDIPDGTPYNDPRITTLTQNMFVVGLKIKMGLPSQILPKDLPYIVDLGNAANNVRFNLLCSEFQIIQNSPPSGFGAAGSWNVWTQPADVAWYFSTTVNLVYADLDSELNTPYFNNNPKKKQELINQLKNLGSGAFSLQQLLFDLDNAALQSIPTIQGLDPNSDAGLILTKSFMNLYFQTAKAHGEPVISVHAIANNPDNSSLRLTGIEREVGVFVDGAGNPIQNLTPEQRNVVTLDYLCAVNNNHLPGAASFSWNWVDPSDVSNVSGVISINRNTLANYYKGILLNEVRRSCIKPWTSVDAHWYGKFDAKVSFAPYQTPQSAVIPESGDEVLIISFASNADANDKSGATYAEFDIHSSYVCTVYFSGNTIKIVQNLKFWVKIQFDLTPASGNVVDKTITDVYTLSVGQNGRLQTNLSSSSEDNSQNIDLDWFTSLFVNLNDMIHSVKALADKVSSTSFSDIPASDIQNFVFPGANVFAYKDVAFSDNQDLLTAITYATPS
ncbi:hypothetical protein D0X99_17520 [Algoriphagus lacus]|uniref:Uncharacterized protein n=1 Tax=Algoriphagus lacus TaxID=2056311 RepID=A0A418PMF9_9BACT|nr:hypothetical protein [Algoriphagus lacus]RIW12898.1 hypothetical protein D0X99_17520 [Algoriphagus lacus]